MTIYWSTSTLLYFLNFLKPLALRHGAAGFLPRVEFFGGLLGVLPRLGRAGRLAELWRRRMFDAGPLPTNLPSSTTEILCNACGYTVSSFLHPTFGPSVHATLPRARAFPDHTGRSDSRRVRILRTSVPPVPRTPYPYPSATHHKLRSHLMRAHTIALSFVSSAHPAAQGSLPSELGLLTAVTAVHLASNALTGVVPSGRCTGARVRVRCAAIPHLLRCQNL